MEGTSRCSKQFDATERLRMRFRAEFFNIGMITGSACLDTKPRATARTMKWPATVAGAQHLLALLVRLQRTSGERSTS